MEDNLLKDVKNIRTISRMALVDEMYQNIYCQENLSFVQMLLLCQMSMYGLSKEVIQGLVDSMASPDEIKQVFREQIMSEAFLEIANRQKVNQGNIEMTKEVLDILAEESKNIIGAIKRLCKSVQEGEGELLQKQEILIQKIDSGFQEQKNAGDSMKSNISDLLDGGFSERKYSLIENTAWKKIKGNLGLYSAKKLSVIYRALEAGILPSKLVPYLDNLSVEQLELVVCILTKETKGEDLKNGK